MAPSSPTKIGKYDVEERVGEGAMGIVYRALDPVLKRTVAIKVMGEAFAQNDDLRERFLREAQAAGSLQHPNVITIYDFGEVDGHLYIAMEFVEGQDVAELLAHQVPLTEVNKLDIAIGVLQGLAFAHKRGIVHRDVKPANIRVDSDGNARIMDFGVAHFASSNMTRTGVMIGTPSYMAPEQITGGRVGPQCDIFSVGAVLYELLTGISPFAGGSLQAVMYRVLSEAPQPVTSSAPGLSPRLNEIVARALAKDPADRYATAIEMANDLLAVRASLDQRPPLTGTLSLRATIDSALDERRTQTFRRVRRRRYAFSGAGVGVAVALVLSGWLLARRTTTTSSGAPNPVNASSPTGVVASAPAPTGKEVVRVDSPPKPVEVSRGSQSSGPPPVQARTSSARTVSPAPQLQSQVTRQTVSTGAPASGRSDAPSVTAPPAAPLNQQPVVTGAPPVAAIPNPPPTSNSSVDVTPPQPAATPTTSSATANAAAVGEINGVIDAYARAIESRDMAELRRVYGAITTNQASAFTEFFKSTRTLRASLAVKNTQVDGNKGTAHVAGTYEFTTTGGRTQQQPVAFDADLRREGGSWKLVAVR